MALASEPLPEALLALARQCVLDWLGVALVGSRQPLAGILIAQAIDDGGASMASVVQSGRKFSARQAALINGAAGHAIDYDDANVAAQGHVTAAVLPAALAIAQARGLGGERLLRAFIAGYEAAGMVGQYVGREHYERGFHGTGTVGSFGASAAAAVLLDLDALGMAQALGISGTQAAGLKAQFGTMCKPFHAGKAAENGVVGAQLAARGFSSRGDLLEAPQGFGAATSPRCDAERAMKEPAGGYHLHGNLFKYHSACYGTHGAIEALGKLRDQHGLSPAHIRRVELRVEPGADRMCNIASPRTGLEAKFSLRFNAALALAGEDTASPATYADAITRRPDLCAMRDAVTVRLMPTSWPLMLSEATVETVDGRVFEGAWDTGVPCEDMSIQGERLLRKFMTLADPVVGQARAAVIAETVKNLESLPDIGRVMSLIQ